MKTKMKSGDLVMIDYKLLESRLPSGLDGSYSLILKIEESSMMAYIISSFGTRWEFMTNLKLIE